MNRALAYLILSLLPVLSIILGQGPVIRLQSQFHDAQELYEQALQTTRLQLGELGRELKSNPALTQDLRDQSFSAASRILGGYAVAGKVDQLTILDSACKYLAHSEQGLLLSADCPFAKLKTLESPSFQWRTMDDKTSLDLITPLGTFGDRSFFLITSTWIRDSWLFHFPALRDKFRELDLSMGPRASKSRLVWQENPTAEAAANARLFTQHPLLRLYPKLLSHNPSTLQFPLWVSLGLFVLALVNLIRIVKVQDENTQKDLQGLQSWADELLPDDRDSEKDEAGHRSSIELIKARLHRMVKRNYEQLQTCRQHSHHLSQQIVSLEARIMNQQVEQVWLQQARSLHQQMNRSAAAHLQKLADLHSLGEDISHLTASQLARPAQKLQELGQSWASELKLVSPRKLIRSMAERVDGRGESELEKAVKVLVESGQNLGHTAINVTILTQSLLGQLQENIHLAEHWHRMMGATEKGHKSLSRLINESQTLIVLQDHEIAVNYQNQLNEGLFLSHLKIPESTILSVLYHGQMALLELARERAWASTTLHRQSKTRDNTIILVISLRGPNDDDIVTTQAPPAADQHLQLALQLLQGYPMKLTRLPALQGILAVALMWEKAEGKAQATAQGWLGENRSADMD